MLTDLSMVNLLEVWYSLPCGSQVKKTARTRGGNYVTQCPQCGDHNGLYILPDAINDSGVREGKWACRTCHPKESDCLQMLTHFGAMTIAEAFKRLRELYPDLPDSRDGNGRNGIRTKSEQRRTVRIKPFAETAIPPCEAWQAYAKQFLAYAQQCLWNDSGKEALAYLISRGLSVETIRAAGYGFLPRKDGKNAVREPAHLWGLSAEDYPDGVFLPSGIIIPYFYRGDLWKLRIRRLGDDVPHDKRYSLVSGSSNGLYNADDIRPGQAVFIFEGEFDADSAKQVTDLCCVATGSLTHARIEKWQVKLALASHVFICFDNEAKQTTTADAIAYWLKCLKNASVYDLPPGQHDANAMLQSDPSGLSAWIFATLGDGPALARIADPEEIASGLVGYLSIESQERAIRVWHVSDEEFRKIIGMPELHEAIRPAKEYWS